MRQQFVNATPWGRQPAYLIHDRDAVYGKALPATLASIGVRSVGAASRIRGPESALNAVWGWLPMSPASGAAPTAASCGARHQLRVGPSVPLLGLAPDLMRIPREG